jgi:hypothetical protein
MLRDPPRFVCRKLLVVLHRYVVLDVQTSRQFCIWTDPLIAVREGSSLSMND